MLRKQLLTWLLVPLALLLTADTFVSYWVALDFSRRAYDRSLIEIAHEISLHLRNSAGTLELDLPDPVRRVLLNDQSEKISFAIIASDGRLLAGDPIIGANGKTARGSGSETLYNAMLNGVPVRVVELRIEANPASGHPGALVRVAETEVKRKELAREILASVVLPQVLLILIAGAIVWVGVAHGLAPLQRLQRAIAMRPLHDRSPVMVAEVPGEVRPLLHSINGLLERLDGALTLQSRFIADAAHQLKTPVAALQAQMEFCLRQDDGERIRESVRSVHGGLERLARLMSQLLSLARNEPEAAHAAQLNPVDLSALAFEVASSWVPEAFNRRIDLGFEGSNAGVMIAGDPVRLRELFDNLLDNAIRYSMEGGHVTVLMTASPCPTVSVSDDGPRIPPHERSRVFERFHRLLGSPRDGSGLGLAIAREIARIHSAEISLIDDTDGIGNMFSVSFPPLHAR